MYVWVGPCLYFVGKADSKISWEQKGLDKISPPKEERQKNLSHEQK